MPYVSDVKDTQETSKYYIGFPKGLNSIQDPALIHDKNISVCTNAILEVDGISRRPGTEKVYDEGSATYVYGSAPFYKKSDSTRKWLRIAETGTDECYLQYLNGDIWTNIGSTTWSAADAHFVQARDRIYIYNGIDPLRYYDGSTVTTYTSVSTPTSLAITPTGTTGSETYSYRVEAVNATGKTAACARVTTSTGNATLSASNYNALAWDAMSGADAYNVFGRVTTGTGEEYLATVYTNSYNDTGADVPTTGFYPNEYNTTGGLIAKYAIFALDRQFAIGVTEGSQYYPTRLYYSGTINYIDAFVGGDYGGGWVDVKSNDGGEIVDIVEYQNGVLVLKTNGVYKFYFTSAGLPALDQISTSHGAVSNRGGKMVNNDYVYIAQKDSKIAVMTVGQQAQYVGDQLRTNDISIFVSNSISTMELSKTSQVCAFLYDYKFGFAMTTSGNTENSEGFVLDTRFGGWVKWTGLPMEVSHYVTYDDGSTVKLYGGSNSDGYMIELFKTNTNDNGDPFTTVVSTKSWNQGLFNVEKVYRNPALWFKYVSYGSISVEVFADGTRSVGTGAIAPTDSGTMVGEILPGESLTGVSPFELQGTESGSDYPQELIGLIIERSIRFTITDSNLNSNWLLMGVNLMFTPLEGKPMDQANKVYLS